MSANLPISTISQDVALLFQVPALDVDMQENIHKTIRQVNIAYLP